MTSETLVRLDMLEGYREHNPETSFYNRVKVYATDMDHASGEELEVYIYEINRTDMDEQYYIPSGVY